MGEEEKWAGVGERKYSTNCLQTTRGKISLLCPGGIHMVYTPTLERRKTKLSDAGGV